MTETHEGPGNEARGLDPARDPVAWESTVRSILAAAEPELARRSVHGDPVTVLLRWSRPVMSAAAALVVLASAALLTTGLRAPSMSEVVPRTGDSEEPPVLAEALVSPTVAAWLVADRSPTLEEAVDALQGAGR